MGHNNLGWIIIGLYSNQHESFHNLYQLPTKTDSVVSKNMISEGSNFHQYTLEIVTFVQALVSNCYQNSFFTILQTTENSTLLKKD